MPKSKVRKKKSGRDGRDRRRESFLDDPLNRAAAKLALGFGPDFSAEELVALMNHSHPLAPAHPGDAELGRFMGEFMTFAIEPVVSYMESDYYEPGESETIPGYLALARGFGNDDIASAHCEFAPFAVFGRDLSDGGLAAVQDELARRNGTGDRDRYEVAVWCSGLVHFGAPPNLLAVHANGAHSTHVLYRNKVLRLNGPSCIKGHIDAVIEMGGGDIAARSFDLLLEMVTPGEDGSTVLSGMTQEGRSKVIAKALETAQGTYLHAMMEALHLLLMEREEARIVVEGVKQGLELALTAEFETKLQHERDETARVTRLFQKATERAEDGARELRLLRASLKTNGATNGQVPGLNGQQPKPQSRTADLGERMASMF
jgi:hypothetical protein